MNLTVEEVILLLKMYAITISAKYTMCYDSSSEEELDNRIEEMKQIYNLAQKIATYAEEELKVPRKELNRFFHSEKNLAELFERKN